MFDSNGNINIFGWVDDLGHWLVRSLFGRHVGIVRRIITWAIVIIIFFVAAKAVK
jgi:hypothetical protein